MQHTLCYAGIIFEDECQRLACSKQAVHDLQVRQVTANLHQAPGQYVGQAQCLPQAAGRVWTTLPII